VRAIVGLVLLSMMSDWSASLQSQQSSGPIVLRNIRVVDGTGSVALPDQTIVIHGAQISAVGDSSRVQIPPGAKELDLAGHTALPGLVLLHEHLFFMVNEQFSHALPFSAPRLYLAFQDSRRTMRSSFSSRPASRLWTPFASPPWKARSFSVLTTVSAALRGARKPTS
jgi:hypothetical protein